MRRWRCRCSKRAKDRWQYSHDNDLRCCTVLFFRTFPGDSRSASMIWMSRESYQWRDRSWGERGKKSCGVGDEGAAVGVAAGLRSCCGGSRGALLPRDAASSSSNSNRALFACRQACPGMQARNGDPSMQHGAEVDTCSEPLNQAGKHAAASVSLPVPALCSPHSQLQNLRELRPLRSNTTIDREWSALHGVSSSVDESRLSHSNLHLQISRC